MSQQTVQMNHNLNIRKNAGQGYTNTSTAIPTVHNVSGNDANPTAGTYKGITGSSAGPGTGQEFDVEVSPNRWSNCDSFKVVQVMQLVIQLQLMIVLVAAVAPNQHLMYRQ